MFFKIGINPLKYYVKLFSRLLLAMAVALDSTKEVVSAVITPIKVGR